MTLWSAQKILPKITVAKNGPRIWEKSVSGLSWRIEAGWMNCDFILHWNIESHQMSVGCRMMVMVMEKKHNIYIYNSSLCQFTGDVFSVQYFLFTIPTTVACNRFVYTPSNWKLLCIEHGTCFAFAIIYKYMLNTKMFNIFIIKEFCLTCKSWWMPRIQLTCEIATIYATAVEIKEQKK